jgi:predicted glycosyltransferase
LSTRSKVLSQPWLWQVFHSVSAMILPDKAVPNLSVESGAVNAKSGRPAPSSVNRKIWIDLDNSPHIPFFIPIIEELEKRGYSVLITARDCFQVLDLARLHGLRHKVIGRHYGKSKLLKVAGLCVRTLQLIPTVLKERPQMAISHGSRAQLVACWLLRIPSIVIMDYEFAQGLEVIHPRWVMCPEVVARSATHPRHRGGLLTYPGIKEDVYVPRFTPNPDILRELGLDPDDIVVTIRPPATEAHYHNPEAEVLLDAVFDMLARMPDAKVILVPRNLKQEEALRRAWPELFASGKVRVPGAVVDGLNLIWHSDLVISGGGTMNREAAALGVPVYSIFRGPIGAVDRYLASTGRLVLLESAEEVRSKINVRRRARGHAPASDRGDTLKSIVESVVGIMEARERK